MVKHRAGDRRIISISIPEELAKKLDRRVGKGKAEGGVRSEEGGGGGRKEGRR